MVRRIITIVLAALAAIALCALAAPHAHAASWEDAQSGPDGGGGTVVDGTPQAGDEGGGTIDVPQSGRGPSMDEQPAPGGRTRLRDVLRPCVTEADALDGCYDASRDSGLWRSPEGGEYRTYDDGTWTWEPAGTAADGPESPSDGTADADTPEGAADAPEPAYAAPEGAPEGPDAETLPDVAADAPEVLAGADDQYAADDDVMPGDGQYADDAMAAPDDSAAAPTDDGQYAADGTRVALAHTGPSTTMAATLAAGAAAAILAGAALMALARADR